VEAEVEYTALVSVKVDLETGEVASIASARRVTTTRRRRRFFVRIDVGATRT